MRLSPNLLKNCWLDRKFPDSWGPHDNPLSDLDMRAIGTFSNLATRGVRCLRPDLFAVASSSSSSSYGGIYSDNAAMSNRAYSTTTVLNARRVRWDHTIKKWDVSGKGFDQFAEQKEKLDEVIHTGRSWTPADLRRKSFDDLHKLWFVLYKERNMLLSEREKIRRLGRPVSAKEESRYTKVKRSMGAIKFVLNERSKIRKELEYAQVLESIKVHTAADGTVDVEAVQKAALKKLADTKPGGVSK